MGKISNVIDPVYVGVVNGHNLRFFRGLSQEPQLPFHSHDDLLECLELSRNWRRVFKRKLVNEWSDNVQTVATSDGIVTIAPHYVAQGLISALQHYDASIAERVDRDYHKEGATALELVVRQATGDLGPIARFNFAMAAAKNQ